MTKVSVIMPVYNAADYLVKSVDCILNQTLEDLELICVDDGSTDDSLDILNDIASKDSRVSVYHQTNRGGGAARNSALKHTTGEYLYFMDADDELDLNAFSDFYEISQKNSLDFIIFKAINYADDTGEYFETDYYNMAKIAEFAQDKVFSPDDLGELIFNISVTPWCKFYNLEFVKRSGARFLEGSIFHDNQFFWEVLFNAKRMYFIDKAYYTRRRHSASSTGAGDERYVNIINVVNNIILLFEKYEKLDDFKHILYNKKVLWTYTRYVEIKDEFKDLFFNELKKDYSKTPEDFTAYLDGENLFIFKSVLDSKTPAEFDKTIESHRNNFSRKLKNKLKSLLK
ncbi:glycosyltransferase [uncultured Methanobrevibacter sp.]|uniref:glycosyltransferase family 2 protein n=1 Tax=uncultured Methanobrevibacter sp. TaxID=253161 RepID=UPI00263485FD|nr:glycosyltransferase [uncultured Methanobrevibacter sp.]